MPAFPKSFPKQFPPAETSAATVSTASRKRSAILRPAAKRSSRQFRTATLLLLAAASVSAVSLCGCSNSHASASAGRNNGDYSITSPASEKLAQDMESRTNQFAQSIDVPTASISKPLPEPSTQLAATRPTTAPATQPAPIVAAPATQPAISMLATPTSPMGAMTTAVPGSPTPANAAPSAPEPSFESAMNAVRKQALTHPTLTNALALALLNPAGTPPQDLVHQLSPADQKLCTDLLAAIQSINAGNSSSESLADRAAPLVDAARRWQADADLALPKCCFASRVDSFGVYTAMDPKFAQGVNQPVIVYCEVGNFGIRKADDGMFETSLSQQETLVTTDGLLVWRPNPEEVTDRSHNERHDFYLVKKLTIPGTLALGKYLLRMSVTDKVTNKIAMITVPLEVVAK